MYNVYMYMYVHKFTIQSTCMYITLWEGPPSTTLSTNTGFSPDNENPYPAASLGLIVIVRSCQRRPVTDRKRERERETEQVTCRLEIQFHRVRHIGAQDFRQDFW